jgi:hypothetical protein
MECAMWKRQKEASRVDGKSCIKKGKYCGINVVLRPDSRVMDQSIFLGLFSVR